MAGKRKATSDLNHNNWDHEEDPVERGTFRTATEEELKNRVIKRAKCKIASDTGNGTTNDDSSTKSVFSSFTGFGKSSAASTAALYSPFSFLSKIPVVSASTSPAVSSSATTGTIPTFSFGINSSIPKAVDSSRTTKSLESSANGAAKSSAEPNKISGLSEYYRNLSSLNHAVSEWIKAHVEKNAICILSPIFKDYEKHLEKIENEKIKHPEEVFAADAADKTVSRTDMESCKFSISNANSAGDTSIAQTVAKTNGVELKSEEPSVVKPSITTGFNFGLNSSTSSTITTSTATSSPTFSFSNQSTNPSKTFSFTPAATPFTFANIKPPDAVCSNTTMGCDTNEEKDEDPPKHEFKQVVEDDAVYGKKCKVFVKKNGSFVDKGVGTLYLKPVETSRKTQLLVRADTNLGNILVNLILNSAIPTQRIGKNNVMMVCLPTPDVEKPTSILLRVKTSEEADELLENIDKYKN